MEIKVRITRHRWQRYVLVLIKRAIRVLKPYTRLARQHLLISSELLLTCVLILWAIIHLISNDSAIKPDTQTTSVVPANGTTNKAGLKEQSSPTSVQITETEKPADHPQLPLANPHYDEGMTSLHNGNYDTAIKMFEEAIEHHENELDAHYRLGNLYQFIAGDSQKAQFHLNQYTRLLSQVPPDEQKKLIEKEPSGEKKHQQALEFFQNALENAAQGDMAGARTKLIRAIEFYDTDPMFHYNLAVVSHKLNYLTEAITHYRRAVELAPNDAHAWTGLGIACQQHGDAIGAIEAYKKSLTLDPKNLPALNNMAILLEKVDMLDDAIDRYQQIIEIDPTYTRAYNNLGTVLARTKKYDQAIVSLKKALKIDSEYLEPHFNLGMIYEEMGNTVQALEEYRFVFLKDAQYPGITEKIASLEKSSDSAEITQTPHQTASIAKPEPVSEKKELPAPPVRKKSVPAPKPEKPKPDPLYLELKNAVDKNPKLPAPYIELGDYFRGKKDYDKALSSLESALNKKPGDPDIRMRIAQVYGEKGYYYRAIKELNALLEQHPAMIKTHYILSLLYVDKQNPLRDSQKALYHYKKYIESGGNPHDKQKND